jgi:hypothetical protein
MSLHNLRCHIYLLNTGGAGGTEPLIDYSMSNVLVVFKEYLSVLLMDNSLVEGFREKVNNKDK